MRFLILALTLSSSAVLAQTTSLQITIPNQAGDTLTLGGPEVNCSVQRLVNWTLTATSGVACSDLNIWITNLNSCADAPATTGDTDLVLQTVSQGSVTTTTSGTPDFRLDELPGLKAGGDAGTTCGQPPGRTLNYRVCGSLRIGTGVVGTCDSSTIIKGNTLKVVYDTEAPEVPEITSIASLDSALSITVEANGGDPNQFRVRVTRVSDGAEVANVVQGTEEGQFRVSNLQNDVPYRVEASALDPAGNESAATAPEEGTPRQTEGFYERYRRDGGQEQGGCDVAGGGLAGGAMLAALGFWLSSRRNRS
ncbi:hypothetical protein P2318_23050 [Myxococcaceae bacterium GXIMD 01537]